MPPWLRTLVTMGILMVVFLVAVAVMTHRFVSGRGVTPFETAEEDGSAFGAAHIVDDCVDEIVRRAEACPNTERTCLPEVASFAWGCLEAAPYEDAFCEDIPSASNPEAYGWAFGYCEELGYPESGNCQFSVMVLVSYCDKHRDE